MPEHKGTALAKENKTNQPLSSVPSSPASSDSGSSYFDPSPPGSPFHVSDIEDRPMVLQKGKGLRGHRQRKEDFQILKKFVEEASQGVDSGENEENKEKMKKKEGRESVYDRMARDEGISS